MGISETTVAETNCGPQFDVPATRTATMPSPFPGMNPYLEQDAIWQGFHLRYLAEISARLVAQVRPNYIVMIDEHIYVNELPDAPRKLVGRGDISVAGRGWPGRGDEEGGGVAVEVLEAPAEVLLEAQDIERVPFLEVRDRQSRKLIAVLELLSPSNKRGGPDRAQYLAKRDQLLASEAHFVEIDLLRGGQPMPPADRPDCDYSVLVSRAEVRPRAGFWPIGLRERLPIIPIPLRQPAEFARIDLQEILHHVYDVSGYADFLYENQPEPRLSNKDAAWARELGPANP
jgi:hypothetical protein